VHRVLGALADTGVVRAEGQDRVTAYRFDPAHPLAPAIAALFAAEDTRADRVVGAVRAAAAAHRPDAVWLFGSAARGEDVPGSDVDVAVVFRAGTPDAALDDVRAALRPADDCRWMNRLSGHERDSLEAALTFPDRRVSAQLDGIERVSGRANTGEVGRALGPALGSLRFTRFQRRTMPVLVIAGRQDGAVTPS
jgi:pimeloyl-ACP methyl ester carboxylesterase